MFLGRVRQPQSFIVPFLNEILETFDLSELSGLDSRRKINNHQVLEYILKTKQSIINNNKTITPWRRRTLNNKVFYRRKV